MCPCRRLTSAGNMSRVSVPRRHHIIISCDVGGSVLIVIGCRIVLPPPRVLSSHRWRLSCGGRRSFLIRPLSRSRMSWGKRRRIGFPAHRSRVSLRFSFLVSPCRLVERLVLYRRCGVRSLRVSGFAVLLVASRRGRSVLRLFCGGS